MMPSQEGKRPLESDPCVWNPSLRELIWDKQMTSHMLHQEVSREFQATNKKVMWQREVCCPSISSLPLVLSQPTTSPETSCKTNGETDRGGGNKLHLVRWQQEYEILREASCSQQYLPLQSVTSLLSSNQRKRLHSQWESVKEHKELEELRLFNHFISFFSSDSPYYFFVLKRSLIFRHQPKHRRNYSIRVPNCHSNLLEVHLSLTTTRNR